MNNNYIVKEYFNLNDHYLSISLINNKDIHLVSYNSSLLNGIKYETLIKAEEILKKSQNKNFSPDKLYDLIIQKIEAKKFVIKSDLNSVNITLLESNNIFNQNLDIQVVIPKNKSHITTEYEKVLSNEITKLREENKNMANSINELKNIIELNKCAANNNNLNSKPQSKLYNSYQNNKSKKLHSSKNDFNNSKNNIDNNIYKDPINNQNNPKVFTNNSSNQQIENQNKCSNNLNNNISKNNIDNNLNSSHTSNNNNNNKNNNTLKSNNNLNNSHNKNMLNLNNNSNNINIKKSTDLSISRLCNLEFENFPKVEINSNPFLKISGYGANTYNGIARNYNEDRLKIILDYKLNRIITDSNGKMVNPQISYFAIYDGHGGNKCSNFLQENLHKYIFESDYFPLYPLQAIYQAYDQAEKNFEKLALDMANKKLLDKSGSCALSALIVDDYCFVTNLGDSRGLYSFDTGKQLFQITRDHKPNDSTEKKRIEKAGGKIYKDTRVKVDGVKVKVNAEDAPGFKFPYRVSPGNLAVSIFYIYFLKNIFFI